MTLSAQQQRELDDYLDALCDEQPAAERTERIHQLLRESPEARHYYIRYLLLHGAMNWDRAGVGEASARPEAAEIVAAARPSLATRVFQSPRNIALLVASLCILLVLATAAVIYPPLLNREQAKMRDLEAAAPVASIKRSVDVRWKGRSPQTLLTPGDQLHLTAGFVEIAFDGGATVVLEGPTDFAVHSADKGQLHAGRLVARAPPAAAGFTIQSHDIDVVDLGTEFGVAVSSAGDGEVTVFEGQVQLRPAGGKSGGETITLGANQSAILRSGGRIVRGDQQQPQPFVRTLPVEGDDEVVFAEDFDGPERKYRPDSGPGIFYGATKWGEFAGDLNSTTDVRFRGARGDYFHGECPDDREETDAEHNFPKPPGHAITFGPIDVSKHRGLQLHLRLAATSDPAAPFDGRDFLIVEAAFDGGPFRTLAEFRGPPEGTGPLRAPLAGRVRHLTQDLAPFQFPLPARQSVEVRIRAESTHGSSTREAVAIDDVEIRGLVPNPAAAKAAR